MLEVMIDRADNKVKCKSSEDMCKALDNANREIVILGVKEK